VIGGLNPYAVEHAAAMGAKIVWLPTLAAENHFRWEKTSGWVHPASTSKIRAASAIPVLNADRTVRDDVREVLDIVARSDIALASGHIHASETRIVFEEAKRRGVTRLIFTHPEDIVGASLDDVRDIADMGAYVEHSLCMFLEGCKFKSCEAFELQRQIEAASPDRTILCSDLGQVGTFHPLEGIRRGIKLCIDFGYSDADIRKMVSLNTAKVLGIESDLPARAVSHAFDARDFNCLRGGFPAENRPVFKGKRQSRRSKDPRRTSVMFRTLMVSNHHQTYEINRS
jgi:hypothetical protein